MVIEPKRRAIRQPQGVAKIDRSNPLTKGLKFAAYPVNGTYYDVVGKSFAALNGSGHTQAFRGPKNPPGQVNLELRSNNTGGWSWPANSTGLDKLNGALSCFWEAADFSSGADADIIDSLGSTGSFAFNIDNLAGAGDLYVWVNGGTAARANGALGTSSQNFKHRAMLTLDGSNARFYANGVLNTTSATTSLPTTDTSRKTTIAYDGTNFYNAAASVILAWDRVLDRKSVV